MNCLSAVQQSRMRVLRINAHVRTRVNEKNDETLRYVYKYSLSAYHLNNLCRCSYSLHFSVMYLVGIPFTSLHAMKEGKTGNGLIQE